MSFCTECGRQLKDDARFCEHCGGKQDDRAEENVEITTQPALESDETTTPKRKKKKWWIIGIAICLVIGTALAIVGNILSKRATFDIEFSEQGVRDFMKVVCRNVDGKAKIVDVEDAYDYIISTVEVKLDGKMPRDIEIVFHNKNDSDKVVAIFFPSTTRNDNALNCEIELILALERTLFGTTHADDRIELWENEPKNNRVRIFEYTVDGLKVQVRCTEEGISYSIRHKES